MHDKRFPTSEAHRLDDPARKVWLPPAEVLGVLTLRSGDTVADLGAGTGYFSLPLAQAVGAEGKVYAVDAQAEMLAHLRQKLHERSVSNVELIHAEAESTALPEGCCSLVFLANVWHEFADRSAVLEESRRILKHRGRIAIIDWRPDVERETGPPLDHRLDASNAVNLLRSTGFHQAANVNVGRYSWLVQGEKLQ
ncbi:MAG TPA: class I SAM-dependent methyltransferase [Terracidiphilus sp.]|nr:class I SAM-dependent methyltransferase [Terracidiphilus sp.]